MVAAKALSDLKGRVGGEVLTRDAPGYSAAVQTWDQSVQVHAPVVVRAGAVEDIAIASRWAADNGLGVAILSTGHGALTDASDAVGIDVRRLTGVGVDIDTRRVTVQPGARWGDVQADLTPHGLSGLLGGSAGVGVTGYLLGGGLSPIGRTFGMAADRVRRLRVLDADYREIEVSADEEPELYWALCGGGGLGIVVGLEFEVVALASLFGGGVYFAGGDAGEVLNAYRSWVPSLDERTSTSIALLHLPPIPQLPDDLRGRFVVHLRIAHVDPADRHLEATGPALLAPMLSAGEVILDYARVMTADMLPDIHRDPVAPTAVSYRGGHVDDIDDDVIADMVSASSTIDGPTPTLLELRHLEGAFVRSTSAPNSATARNSKFALYVSASFDPSSSQSLVDGIAARIGSPGVGAQLNFYGPAPEPRQILSLWDPSDAARLISVQSRLDPDNRIRSGRPLR